MGTTRTSEPESLNIGTPFQMTLEAVGTPSARSPSGRTALQYIPWISLPHSPPPVARPRSQRPFKISKKIPF